MNPIVLLVGTRPEMIKMAPIYWAFVKHAIPVVIYTTGQHTNLLQLASSIFNIVPKSLTPLEISKSLVHSTTQLLDCVNIIIQKEKPGVVLVHGDTSTAFAGALASFYNRIPVGHIEAGLRTGDLEQPFPEEFNRQAIARIATYHFAPTNRAKRNLEAENISGKILVAGNSIVDALLFVINKIAQNPVCVLQKIREQITVFQDTHKKIIVITLHRRELFLSGNYEKIIDALIEKSLQNPMCALLFVTHLNPTIQQIIAVYKAKIPSNFYWVDPLEYQDFIFCLMQAHCIITDSGGVIEEAAIMQCPAIIVREKTERPESCTTGNAVLVGYDTNLLKQVFDRLIAQPKRTLEIDTTLYGDGTTSEKIVQFLLTYINCTQLR